MRDLVMRLLLTAASNRGITLWLLVALLSALAALYPPVLGLLQEAIDQLVPRG